MPVSYPVTEYVPVPQLSYRDQIKNEKAQILARLYLEAEDAKFTKEIKEEAVKLLAEV